MRAVVCCSAYTHAARHSYYSNFTVAFYSFFCDIDADGFKTGALLFNLIHYVTYMYSIVHYRIEHCCWF